MTDDVILRVDSLAKTYRSGVLGRKRHTAIHDLSLAVGRGSVFGLLGPNGAGKTTLVKVLLGLARYDSGRAELFGEPVGRANPRRRVGYLPEAHRLPGYLTGRQVLRVFAMMCGREKSWVEPRLDRWIEAVGMEEGADRKVREYSKGMQQRIGLAQALIHEPELVFLDEPTDGVDPVGRKAIRGLIERLRSEGVTVFINSHLLLEVERMCDRVVIMHRGRLIREGTIEELTPQSGFVQFELSAPLADVESLVSDLGRDYRATKDNAFEIGVDQAEQDAVVDRLRGAGLSIASISRRRASLEDAFIDLVQEGGAS